MKFLLVTICILGVAATLARGDPCPCQTSTTTTAPDCGCDCGGDGGDGSDGTWNEGVTHYWPFDNDLIDTVGHDHIQKCVGDWHYDTDRLNNENGSITFNGAFCTLPPGVYLAGPFSIAMWAMLPADSTENGTVVLLLFSHMISYEAIQLAITWDSGAAPIAAFVMQSASIIISEVVGEATVPVGEWFHIAATFDGMTAKLYINGNFDSQDNASDVFYGVYRNANDFGGADSLGNPISTFVSYDDVRIYGRDLSSDEVTGLYNAPNTAPTYERENVDVRHCNDEPYGECLYMCNSTLPFPLHIATDPCGDDLMCCVEQPVQEENGCHSAGGFCVQRDSCRVSDLIYVADGCTEASVVPICCAISNYYDNREHDPFGINANNNTHCDGPGMTCYGPSDCCSLNCMMLGASGQC